MGNQHRVLRRGCALFRMLVLNDNPQSSPPHLEKLRPTRVKNTPYNENPTMKGNVMLSNDEKNLVAKFCASSVAGWTAYIAATEVLENNLEEPESKPHKIALKLGVAGLAGLAGSAVSAYTIKQYDDVQKIAREFFPPKN